MESDDDDKPGKIKNSPVSSEIVLYRTRPALSRIVLTVVHEQTRTSGFREALPDDNETARDISEILNPGDRFIFSTIEGLDLFLKLSKR